MHGQVAVSTVGRQSKRTPVGNARLALTGTHWSGADNHVQARSYKPLNRFMKHKIFLGLCVVLGAGFISALAADNPAQAVCRAVLDQKLKQPNAWEPQPLTEETSLPAVAMVASSVKPVASIARTASVKAAALQTAPVPITRSAAPVMTATAPASTIPAAAPAPDAPEVTTPSMAASAVTMPSPTASSVTTPVPLLLMVSFLVASFFAVMVLLLKLRQMKLKLREIDPRY